ncbi:MAG: MurR/RpiR family transcriptional regulator [Eubacteriaceae bacterium]
MVIDLHKLNALELDIYEKLMAYTKDNKKMTISLAAEICQCSPSKISKFVKKLGFDNFKQFVGFTQGVPLSEKKVSNELERIRDFTMNFDSGIVENFISMLDQHEKIILFGYGPSYICAQYFEYKLRIHSENFVVAIPDSITAMSQLDNNTLLVVFSATGRFASFKTICDQAKMVNCDILLIVEEYHPQLLSDYETVYFLTDGVQDPELAPHEKSRVAFFIFIEEVILALIKRNQKKSSLQSEAEEK